MSCMISFTLRDSAVDLEKYSHPSHKKWIKILKLLRDMGLENPQVISKSSFCCVDVESPMEVSYLYTQCSYDKFKNIEAICTSETSQLNRQISPLLNVPLSAESILRFDEDIRIVRPDDGTSKCLEFMTFHDIKRPSMLKAFLDQYMPGESCHGITTVPVKSFTSTSFNLREGVEAHCYIIQWKSLEDRDAVFEDASLRQSMKFANKEYRAPICQMMGKSEESLTWEQDLQVFLASTGASHIQSRFFTATLMTDDYLKARRKNGSCVII